MSKKDGSVVSLEVVGSITGVIGIIGAIKWGYDEYVGNHYGPDGFNKYGKDRDGFHRNGYDDDGFNKLGKDADGFYRNGFNDSGKDREGYYKDGFNDLGMNKQGRDREGYDINGFDTDGFDRVGYDGDGNDKAGQNREYYRNRMKKILNNINEHLKNRSERYRYKMLDYRYDIEELLIMAIQHKKGKELLEIKDNHFLCKYIEIVDENKILDINSDDIKKIRYAKNYCGDFLHPKKKEVNDYKEINCVKALNLLYRQVEISLDINKKDVA